MCDFSGDSRWLYISGNGELRAWDLATGKEVPSFTHVGSGGGNLVVSPDGGKLACTLSSDRILIRDARTGLMLHTLQKSGNQMAFSPDSKRLATYRPELTGNSLSYRYFKMTTCSIWDVDTGELVNVLAGTGFNVMYHPDGKRLATAAPSHKPQGKNQEAEEGVVRILDTEAPPALFEFSPEFPYPIALSPMGGYLALCEHTKETVMAAICDVQTGRKVISIGPIVRGGEQVRVYDEDPNGTSAMKNVERYICDIALSPNGRVLASASALEPGAQSLVNTLRLRQAATDNTNVAGCEVKLWDTQTGRELVTIRRPYDRPVGNLSFSPDGHQLVVSSEYESGEHTEVCDAATGQSIFSKLRGGSPVYSPDGRFLATFGPGSGFRTNFLHLWDPRTFRFVRTLRNCVDYGGPSEAITLAFDPPGRRLAVTSGNPDGTIKLFEVASGRQLQVLRGDLARVESICFTPDGERLVSSTPEGPVRLWDTRTGRCLLTLQSSLALPGGNSPNIPWGAAHTRVAVSADGSCIATAGDRVRLWRATPAKTK